MLASTIPEQDGSPGVPSSAVFREYSLETMKEMKADFLRGAEDASSVAGVSLGLANSGIQIRILSPATFHYIFVLALTRPPSQAKNESYVFQRYHILQAHPIVLLAHTLSGDVSGYDPSTSSFESDTSYIRMAGALVKFPLRPLRGVSMNTGRETCRAATQNKQCARLCSACRGTLVAYMTKALKGR